MTHLASATVLPPSGLTVEMNVNGLNGSQPGLPVLPCPSSIAADDWDQLFHAVEARLRNCVGKQLSKTPQLPLQDPAAVVEAVVLECVAAFDQLHAALKRERLQRRELVVDHFVASNERHVRNSSSNLTPARTNLPLSD